MNTTEGIITYCVSNVSTLLSYLLSQMVQLVIVKSTEPTSLSYLSEALIKRSIKRHAAYYNSTTCPLLMWCITNLVSDCCILLIHWMVYDHTLFKQFKAYSFLIKIINKTIIQKYLNYVSLKALITHPHTWSRSVFALLGIRKLIIHLLLL